MTKHSNISFKWLKGLYIYTIIGAGGFGLAMLFAPGFVSSVLGIPFKEPIVYGIAGSVYLAFGILSIFGLRYPLRFVPVLLMQLCYKSAWFLFVFFPLLVTGQLPSYTLVIAPVFATYIIGDLIAIPFRHLFDKDNI
jgi:hypothetical protein